MCSGQQLFYALSRPAIIYAPFMSRFSRCRLKPRRLKIVTLHARHSVGATTREKGAGGADWLKAIGSARC
jgi:hypothetical protein